MFSNKEYSLRDLFGSEYMDQIIGTAEKLLQLTPEEAEALASEKEYFWSEDFHSAVCALSKQVGQSIINPFESDNSGAPTDSFRKASKLSMAPVGGLGCYRIGENGRVYMASKSEHYHTPLGHNFPGYRLITRARKLGILNATHNNTRGYITRLMERQLVAAANGLSPEDEKVHKILAVKAPKVLNRVINLETGSLAVEAGIKMMLSRFYRLDITFEKPKYAGKIPVFFIMQDYNGGKEANYHGTTVIAQTLRGMWPDYYEKLEKAGLYKVVPVAINDPADFEAKIRQYNQGEYKTAGFLHEIILMNYGGIRLQKAFLQKAYALCEKFDTPCMVDEIQSCMWYPGMFLFRLYELKPDFVIVGKGFPGGEYAASKIITTGEMDSLNQFGALVTNGQEELASLSYMITMRFSWDNAEEIGRLGQLFEDGLCDLATLYPQKIDKIEGSRHMAAIHFKTVEQVIAFNKKMNDAGFDVGAQLYKANCPPAALMKMPIIACEEELRLVIEKIHKTIDDMV